MEVSAPQAFFKGQRPQSPATNVIDLEPFLALGREADRDWRMRPTEQIGDATIYGTVSDEIASRQIALAFGTGVKDQRWRSVRGTVVELIERLSVFERGGKDGPALCQGELIAPQRTAKNAAVNHILMLDCDTGLTIDEILSPFAEAGLFAIAWHTFSHNKTTSEIDESALLKYAGVERPADVTLEHARSYLSEVKHYHPRVFDGELSLKHEHKLGGVKFVLRHRPMSRVRVLLLLREPFRFSGRGGTQNEAIAEWKSRYAGVAAQYGLPFDRSCVDPSRLMYLPRVSRDTDITEHEIVVLAGAPLDFEAIEPAEAEPKPNARGRDRNAFQKLGAEAHPSGFETPWLTPRFLAKIGNLRARDLLVEAYEEGLRHDYGNGKCDFECPREPEHSEVKLDDRAFCAVWAANMLAALPRQNAIAPGIWIAR